MSPTGVAHLSQNVLLPVLLEEAQRAAVESCPSTQVHHITAAAVVVQVYHYLSELQEAYLLEYHG